jgi:hypothetical protein
MTGKYCQRAMPKKVSIHWFFKMQETVLNVHLLKKSSLSNFFCHLLSSNCITDTENYTKKKCLGDLIPEKMIEERKVW